MSEQKILKKKI